MGLGPGARASPFESVPSAALAHQHARAVWQHPFVSVFALCETDSWRHVAKQGDVVSVLVRLGRFQSPRVPRGHCKRRPQAPVVRSRTPVQDKTIGKRVFRLTGTVPAANFIQLPKTRSQSLGLTGRFLYLEVRVGERGRVQVSGRDRTLTCMRALAGLLLAWQVLHHPRRRAGQQRQRAAHLAQQPVQAGARQGVFPPLTSSLPACGKARTSSR